MNSLLDIKRSGSSEGFRWPVRLTAISVVVVIALVSALSVWTVYQSESNLRDNLESKLQTILRIEAEAVHQWVEADQQLASFLAADAELAESLQPAKRNSRTSRDYVRDYLERSSQKINDRTCFLMSPDGGVIASTRETWAAEQVDLIASELQQTPALGLPTPACIVVPVDEQDTTGKFALVIATPVVQASNGTLAWLAVVYDAGAELTTVLASSRAGNTGETIAISGSGTFISNSRFEQGSNRLQFLAEQQSEPESLRPIPPKTKMANLRDQRGVEVVCVSKWLPRVGIGLVTKMDQQEAHAPTIEIRRFMWMLCSLLALTTISAATYRWHIYRLRKIAKQSDLNRRQLGAYELEEKVGEGGMGVVYRAKHALLRRPTAVKILPPEKSSQASIKRFEREVKYTSQLKHPNTISIYHYGRTENGLFYYAMEFLEGLNLEQLLRSEGSLPDGRVLLILRQVCESLREAHAMGLIHRDIKPANIMLCDRGGAVDTIKVLDFGMARDSSHKFEVHNDTLSGTPAYMAPECFDVPSEVDARIDIFAVGAVGFFLIAGSPLLQASNLKELRSEHLSDIRASTLARLRSIANDFERPVANSLVRLISKCVSSNREDRFSSVSEVLNELNECRPRVAWGCQHAEQWWRQYSLDNADEQTHATVDSQKSTALDETVAFENPDIQEPFSSLDID